MSIRSESALNTGWGAYGFDAFFGLSVCDEWFRVELLTRFATEARSAWEFERGRNALGALAAVPVHDELRTDDH